MGKIHLNLPNRPPGKKVHVIGYGLFENGQSHEVEGLEKDIYIPPNTRPKEEDETPAPQTSTPPTPPPAPSRPKDDGSEGTGKSEEA